MYPVTYPTELIITCLQVNLKPKVPTKAVCAEHLELRKEILTLLNLQKQVSVYPIFRHFTTGCSTLLTNVILGIGFSQFHLDYAETFVCHFLV